MLPFTTARQLITSLSRSFGQEEIDLDHADGRVLAEAIVADRDYPPFNRSTMDGYAINTQDWKQGIRDFKVQQVIYAGQSARGALQPGACYQIMTGAPVPPSANAVIRREDAIQTDGQVGFNIETIKPHQSIACKGEDLKAGETVLKAHTLCTPAVISLLASLGKVKILVERLPSVALFTTGDEVVAAGAAVAENQIRNGNQYLLKSLLKKWLIEPVISGHVIDDKNLLKISLTPALECDIIITCGGVSAGDADYLPEVLAGLGVKKLFHKVAIKPGKPIWCGQMSNGGLVFALPGNPFSCMVTFKLFIEAYLRWSLGIQMPGTLMLPFKGSRQRLSNLDEFFPVSISGEPSAIHPITINSSGDIRLGLYADAIAHHPATSGDLTDGNQVMCYLL